MPKRLNKSSASLHSTLLTPCSESLKACSVSSLGLLKENGNALYRIFGSGGCYKNAVH